MGFWIFGTAMAVLGLLGLFMASFAANGFFYATGLGLFVFGVGVVMWLIRRATPHH